jgi:hypothetical protein
MRLGAFSLRFVSISTVLAAACLDAGMRLPGGGEIAAAAPAPALAPGGPSPAPTKPTRGEPPVVAATPSATPSATTPVADPPPPATPPAPTFVEYTSPTGIKEKCHLFQSFPFTPPDVTVDPETMRWYRKDDAKEIAKLCSLDFYAKESTDKVTAVGVCPKIHWSTPAFELYDLEDTGLDKTDFQRKRCPLYRHRRNAKKLAKAKTSVYTKENESGLIYFHFSRLLGNAGHVYPATYRSIARVELVKVAREGIAYIEAGNIERTPLSGWKVLRSRHRDKDGAPDIVASSLAKNPRHEVSHMPFKYFADKETKISNASDFARTFYFKLLENRRPILEQVDLDPDDPKDYRAAVQKLTYAHDFTSMAILDHLFLQRDRPGNIHGRVYYHHVNAQGHLRWKKEVGPTDDESTMVPLLRLILKDNDDGIKWGVTPRMNLGRLLDDIHHLDPLVYARIQWLAGLMADPATQPEVKRYFLEVVMISESVYDMVQQRFIAIADMFEKMYERGDLALDLDLQIPIAGAPPLVKEPPRPRSKRRSSR